MQVSIRAPALAVLMCISVGIGQQPEKAVGVKDKTPQPQPRVYAHEHALCIGINDYASPDIPDLSYAEADARDVASVLKELYGFDDVRVLLGRDASKAKISSAIADLFDPSRVGSGDAVVIYFSGHGQTVRQGAAEGGYLIPQDANISLKDVSNPAAYRRDALRMDDLRTDAEWVPAKHVLFLIDACYSGYLAARTVEASPDIAAALRYPARQVITAGTSGERSLEHNTWGHGALTFKLLEILRAEERPLQASRLGVMLKERVPREVAAKFGTSRSLSPQAKYLSGDGDFLFIRTGVLARPEPQPAGAQPDVPAADPLKLLKQGDRRTIEELVSDGQFREASERLAAYEKTNGADEFSNRLRPALVARLAMAVKPSSTTKPAAPRPGELLPLDPVDSKVPAKVSTPSPHLPTAPPIRASGARAKRVDIKLGGPTVGIAPYQLSCSADYPQADSGDDFLWMDNGAFICDKPRASKELTSPGLHRISVLVITKDNREYRGAVTVQILERANP